MKSRIQWRHEPYRTTGTVKGYPATINVYRNEKHVEHNPWYFTIRRNMRNIVVCNKEYKSRDAAVKDASKFMVIVLLMDMDSRFRRLGNADYNSYWFEPIRLFFNQQPVSLLNQVQHNFVPVDIPVIGIFEVSECFNTEDGEQSASDDGGDKIQLTEPLTADHILTAGKDSDPWKDSK